MTSGKFFYPTIWVPKLNSGGLIQQQEPLPAELAYWLVHSFFPSHISVCLSVIYHMEDRTYCFVIWVYSTTKLQLCPFIVCSFVGLF